MGSGVQFFPQVVAPSTFLGRLASGAGPVEAIPFSSLAAAISGTPGALTVTTLTATTSVVTPLVSAPAASALSYNVPSGNTHFWQVNAVNTLQLNAIALAPTVDNSLPSGLATNRWSAVFALIIDSGTIGSLSLRTNNGQTGFQVLNNGGTAVNFIQVRPEATGISPSFLASGSDANVGFRWLTQGTGGFDFDTNGSGNNIQFQILHTASATRNITVTGSNGGNPTIGVTAGSLAIAPSVVISGTTLQVGTTPSASSGVNIPFGNFFASRNSGNSGDIQLIGANTINTVVDVCVVGAGSVGALINGRIVAGAPSTADIPSGRWAVWRDTSGATTKLYYNNAGTLQSVALA